MSFLSFLSFPRFPPPTRVPRPVVRHQHDIGRHHMLHYENHRRAVALDAAMAEIAQDIIARMRAASSPAPRFKPKPQIDDAYYLDGDLKMYGSYSNAEWGE